MLAIDWQQSCARTAHRRHHQCTCGDQGFFVGQSHCLPSLNCCHRRGQSRATDDGGHCPVCIASGGLHKRICACCGFYTRSCQCVLKVGIGRVIRNDGQFSIKFPRQLRYGSGIAVSRERNHAILAAMLANEIQCRQPDRTRGAKDGNAASHRIS